MIDLGVRWNVVDNAEEEGYEINENSDEDRKAVNAYTIV